MKLTNRQSWNQQNLSIATGQGGRSTTATTTAPGLLNAKNRLQVASANGSFVNALYGSLQPFLPRVNSRLDLSLGIAPKLWDGTTRSSN